MPSRHPARLLIVVLTIAVGLSATAWRSGPARSSACNRMAESWCRTPDADKTHIEVNDRPLGMG